MHDRDGGGFLGTGLSVRIGRDAPEQLRPPGRLLLYTATPLIAVVGLDAHGHPV
jgi:hypothetical protein